MQLLANISETDTARHPTLALRAEQLKVQILEWVVNAE